MGSQLSPIWVAWSFGACPFHGLCEAAPSGGIEGGVEAEFALLLLRRLGGFLRCWASWFPGSGKRGRALPTCSISAEGL